MKIALFSDTFFPQVNGVANTVYRLAQQLSHAGHTVRVYTASVHSSSDLQKLAGEKFEVCTLPSLPALVYPGERFAIPFMKAVDSVQEFAPDVIHTHTPFGIGWSAVYCARKLSIPLVGTHHTFFDHYLKHVHLDFGWTRRMTWSLTVRYYNYCDLVTSPTESLAQFFKRHGLKKPIVTLPNLLDTDFYSPAENKHTSGSTILYLGRLSYEKSVEGVITAAALAVKQLPDLRLLIVGDGPQRQTLEEATRRAGIESRTTFTGYRHGAELIATLREADLYISASKSENMPLAVLEAMATGLPIVAVSSLGMKELVAEGKNGFLLEPDDPAALAEKILLLAKDGSLRERFSRSARAASLRFSAEAVTRRIIDLYERVRKNTSEYAPTATATGARGV